jgi:hypothetical protein
MPKLTDEEIAALEAGDDTVDEPVVVSESTVLTEGVGEDAFPDEEDGDDEEGYVPPARQPQPRQQHIPYDRFQEVTQENQRLRGIVESLAGAVQQRPAPANQVQPPNYVRPNDTPEQKAWREFVGETVDPVIAAKLQAIERQQAQGFLGVLDRMDQQNVRNEFPDYDEYASEAETIRANFLQTTGLPFIERRYAYRIARDVRREQRRQQNGGRTSAVRRATAPAAGEAKPPARPARRGQDTLSLERINQMGPGQLKELEALAFKRTGKF